MINVIEYRQTCFACPSQWEGETDDGRYVYARYRHGWFSVEVAPSMEIWWEGRKNWEVVSHEYGDALDGFMDDATLRELTEEVITWP